MKLTKFLQSNYRSKLDNISHSWRLRRIANIIVVSSSDVCVSSDSSAINSFHRKCIQRPRITDTTTHSMSNVAFFKLFSSVYLRLNERKSLFTKARCKNRIQLTESIIFRYRSPARRNDCSSHVTSKNCQILTADEVVLYVSSRPSSEYKRRHTSAHSKDM